MRLLVEEREADPVARAVHDQVGLLLAAVGVAHTVARELGDLRLDRDRAVGEPVEDPRGDRRVGLPEAVVGQRQPVAVHRAHRQAGDDLHSAQQPRERQAARAHPRVERAAEDVLGHHVDPAARDQRGRERVVGGVHGDVHRGVAHPHHDHPPAGELARFLVVVGVDLLAVEGARDRGLRPARKPVVAVGDEQRVVVTDLPGPRQPPRPAIVTSHTPSARGRACSTPVLKVIRPRRPKCST